MKATLIVIFCAANLLVPVFAATAPVTIPLKIENSSAKEQKGFPLVISVKDLPALSDSLNSVKLLSVDKRSYPCQLDDLNSDKKLDKQDEISMLVDLKPGENEYKLIISESSKKDSALEVQEEGKFCFISNDLVKVVAHKTKFHTRLLKFKISNAWISMTGIGTYHSDPKLDNQWKEWKWGKPSLQLISDGPVRKILRETIDKINDENEKSIKLIHDWSIFNGRTEILSVIYILNTSKSQVTQITRMTNGFYDITPMGTSKPDDDSFAGINKKGKMVTDLLKNSRFYVKKPKFSNGCWYDAFYSGKDAPALGFGSVVVSTSGLQAIVLGFIERKGKKKLRMTEAYEPKDAVIWPNKSYAYIQWYILHKGNFQATQNFYNSINSIKIKVVK